MNISNLLTEITTVLYGDSEIKSYCQAKYATDPAVFIGMDRKNPPNIENYPSLIIYDIKMDRNFSRIIYTVSIGIAIENNDVTVNETNKTHLYQGFVEAKELKEIVEMAICANFEKVNFQASQIPEDLFPIMIETTTFAIEFVVSSRGPRERL